MTPLYIFADIEDEFPFLIMCSMYESSTITFSVQAKEELCFLTKQSCKGDAVVKFKEKNYKFVVDVAEGR